MMAVSAGSISSGGVGMSRFLNNHRCCFKQQHLNNNNNNNNNNKKKKYGTAAAVVVNTVRAAETQTQQGKEENGIISRNIKSLSSMELNDYLDQSKEMMMMMESNGPPRWFSPLDCAALDSSPLLLFLPGIDGVGLGLILHHHRLAKIFDIWCLHIPITDRTPFAELVGLVERTVRSESNRMPNRPIYLVAESIGACLALSVAARNPDIDIVLILANSATCFDKSPLQPLLPLLQFMPEQLYQTLPYALASLSGIPLNLVIATLKKRLSLQETIGKLSESLGALSSYLHILADNLVSGETLLWKLQILKEASAYANSHLHAVKAQTLILASGKDQLLPSEEEGERLRKILPKCEIRKFNDCGHALFLEEGVDLVTTIKGASFYRRTRYLDYVSDYMPPTNSEFEKIFENLR